MKTINNIPLVSIIVPVYNTEKYIFNCLNSLVLQSYKNIEIICINDGSTDGSLAILKQFQSKYNIKVITTINNGVSFARNEGIKKANGDYIMFVDSDDWLDSNCIETMVQEMTDNNADTVMCSYVKEYTHPIIVHIFDKKKEIFDKERIMNYFHRRLFGLINEELKYPEKADIIVSPCMQLFDAKIVKGINFYDINKIGSFEDGLFQIDYYMSAHKLIYIDFPFYHYRKNNDNSITTKYDSLLFEKRNFLYTIMLNYIKKNDLPCLYYHALENRIALGIISLGLNVISSTEKKIIKLKQIHEIIFSINHKNAIKNLKTIYMPIKWKVFFNQAKKGRIRNIYYLLIIINFLRKRKNNG